LKTTFSLKIDVFLWNKIFNVLYLSSHSYYSLQKLIFVNINLYFNQVILDRTIAPEIKPLQNFKLKQAQTFKLSNGIPIHVLHDANTDAVKIEFILDAGAWTDTVLGVSGIAMKMLAEGTSKYTATEIAEKIASYGAFFEQHHGADRINLSVYTLSKFSAELVEMVKSMLLDSQMPEKELQKLIEIGKQTLGVNKEKTSFMATATFKEALFGKNHPYGHTSFENHLDSITSSQVVDFYQQYIKSLSSLQIFVSGGLNAEKAIALFEKSFGNIEIGKIPVENKFDISTKNQSIITNKEAALQSSVRLGKIHINRHHPDFLDFTVVNEVLGGYFGSRLMKNIREDKGYTYGIGSQINVFKHATYIAIGADVKKEAREATFAEIEKEIKILQTTLLDNEELNTVTNYMLGAFMGSISTPFALMDKYKMLQFNGLQYDYFDRYYQTLTTIQPERILALANQYLNYDDFVKVSVG